MTDDALVGSVAVEINPRATDFWAKFQAQTRGQASKVGDDLGNQIGKSIADRIAKGIRDGLTSSGRAPAERSGNDAGGAFGTAFKRQVDAAIRAINKVKIDGDTSPVDRAIAEIRAELKELGDKKIGIDISDEEAKAKVNEFAARLHALAEQAPTVQARFDALEAAAKLGVFNAELDRLDGRNVRVDVDASSADEASSSTDRATGSVSALVAAGAGLGPAIIPGAAAAAGAIAAIGPAALGALAGLGVLALAASGVTSAVKAMSAADNQAQQSAVSLAGKQSQVAAASDAVRSAQASLGNAVANAADQQRRASESITNAERSETDANRQLLAAQQAVTQARIDAARAAEDLQSRVAHNALDQQQAALDTTKAEQALAVARANAAASPTAANNQAVTEATLALEQQRLRVKDLSTEQKRLAQDKATSDKQGINGSTQVVAALERVRAATEQVQKAEQSVSDARAASASQARQSAFAIEQAQQGVINSQRALGQATVSTATAGGAALLALQQSMDNLSPAAQRFATFVYGLKAQLLDLRRTAETGLLPGLQAGIQALLPTLPNMRAAIAAVAAEMGHLAQSAGQALASPFWQNFFQFTVSTAIPALDQAAKVAGNFAVGLAGLYRAFIPLGQDVGGGLLRFSREFALHAVTLQNTAGYRDFLNYVRDQGPAVAHTISEVVQAAVRLIEAIAPLGGFSLTAIRLLAEAINALPVPVLTALAAGVIAVVTATKLMSFARVIGETRAFAAAQLLLSDTMIAARAAMASTGPEVGRFGTALAGIRGGARGAASGIGGLLGMVGLGGPLGIGLAVGAVLIGTWANAHAQAAAKIAAHKRAVDDINGAIRQNSGAIDENVRKVAAKNALDQGALGLAQKTGVSLSDVTNAYIHGGTAIDGVTSRLDGYIQAQQEAQQKDQEHSSTYQANIKNARDLIAILGGQKKAVADGSAETARDTAQQKLLDQALSGVSGALANQTPAQLALGAALRTVSDASKTATDRAAALKAADDAVFGAARNAVNAEQDQALSLLQVAAAGKQNAEQQLFGKSTLDLHSEASIRNRQMLEQRFLALGQEYLADVQSGVAVGDATKKHDTNRDAIIKAAEAAGFDTGQVHALANTFGTLPTDPKVQVTVAGVTEALTQMQNLEIAQLALKQGLDPAAATKEWKAQHQQAVKLGQGLATGGPVFGAGGPTDDKIPAWLSNGEHVWTAREVQAAGGHQAVEDLRKRVLGPRGPQVLYPGDGSAGIAFAGGGAVTWPFPVTAALTKIPTLDEIRRAVTFGPDYTGPISGGLEAAAAFVRAQVGKPYVWASAGPGGYDCSGIVSAAFNVAKGRYPYSHTFSTMNEAPYFPLSGYGAFTAGWTNPGEPGPGGSNVGHTAGKIGNMPFESVGGLGVRIGPQVTGIGRFAHVGHFDEGGVLPPGLTIARNDTGRNEYVLRDDQIRGIAGDRGGTTVNVHGSDGMSVHELTQAVMAEMAWQTR